MIKKHFTKMHKKILFFCAKILIFNLVSKMLYTRKEISEKYNSTYQLNKAIENKQIFKIQNSIYSDEKYVNPLAVISKKYPNFIFTMDSAFCYWNLTDVIPDKFCLATKQTSIRMSDENIKQYFIDNELFEVGKTTLNVENIEINIYNKERMLVELVRKKNQLPFDYYKEIINNYRKIVNDLDSFKITEYISYYKNEETLYDRLQSEVY